MYVQSSPIWCRTCHSQASTRAAEEVFDTLRGIQGIGVAAITPASVSIFLVVSVHTLIIGGPWSARNSGKVVSSRTVTCHRVYHFLCRCTSRSSIRECCWWCPYPGDQVSPYEAPHLASLNLDGLTVFHRPTWRTPIFTTCAHSLAFTTLGFFVFEKEEPSTEEDKRVDWIGATLITAGLVLVVFALSDSPTAHKG